MYLERALKRGLKALRQDKGMSATERDAGFLDITGKKKGNKNDPPLRVDKVQVFVKICRYSDALLEHRPDTCGLLVND